MRGEVVMQEELSGHQVEGQVVTSPSTDEETGIPDHTVTNACNRRGTCHQLEYEEVAQARTDGLR